MRRFDAEEGWVVGVCVYGALVCLAFVGIVCLIGLVAMIWDALAQL